MEYSKFGVTYGSGAVDEVIPMEELKSYRKALALERLNKGY